MKKAVHVTIASSLFTLEEDGYQKLQSYLDAIAHYFDALPEGREVKQDIEARIAEQLLERLEVAHTTVVTIDHVNHVIEIMGTVEEITDSAQGEQESAREKSAEPEMEPQPPRRLFRDMDRGVIAGVAAGIAAYFDIDPLIVRVIFILLTFVSGGAMIALYIILALIVPKAQTPADKVRMRGGPVTLSSFKDTVNESAENLRKNGAAFVGAQSGLRRFIDRVFAFFGAIIRGFARLIVVIGSLFLMVFPTIGILILLFVAANLAFNAHSPYFDFPVASVISSGLLYTAIALGVLLVTIPLTFAITFGVSLFARKWKMRLSTGLILVSIWIIAAITAGTLAVRYVPQVHERISEMPQYRVTTETVVPPGVFTQLALQSGVDNVHVVRGPEHKIEVQGTQRAHEMLDFSVQGEILLVAHDKSDRGFCLFCFDHRASDITITMPEVTAIAASHSVDVSVDKVVGSEISITLSDAARAVVELEMVTTSLRLADVSRLTLLGSTTHLGIYGTDAARLIAPEFTALRADVALTDVFRANTRVTQSLYGTARDASRVMYTGAATNSVSSYDASKVERENGRE
ncbi:MAG: PspC domain-containing protein [Patescibacteria group bacterium]